MQLGLLITARCNAACTHCSTSCGPRQTTALSREDIFRLMDEAAAIEDGKPLVFSLSGGEPFLNFDLLREIVAYGARLGGEVTCVTNGYWAASDEKARTLLATLRAAGLRRLGVSTSRFHQRYVKLARVQRALKIATDVGIDAVLKYATTRSDESEAAALEAWARSIGISRCEPFPVLPYLREGEELPQAEYRLEPGLPADTCPIPSLTLRETGTAYSCCAPGGFVDFLSLGNAVEEGLEPIYRRFLLNGRQKLLREKGPIQFARAIQARGLGHHLRKAYAGACDLCAHIASDPVLAEVAREEADRYEQEYLTTALMDMARRMTTEVS